ncbi:hypothetical protein [Lactovum odontotermitis]
MKKKVIISLSAMLIVFFSAGLFLTRQDNSAEKAAIHQNKGKTIHLSGSYAIDPTNLAQVAGISDNVFIGEVMGEKETVYTGEARTPVTVYKVKVLENLKGELSKKLPVKLYKFGGTAENGNLFIFEDDEMPQAGNYYAFSTQTTPSGYDLPAGSILASGMNSNIRLDENEVNGEKTGRSSGKILEFQDAVKAQVPFDRKRGEIVDSETYFSESLPE